MLPISGLKKKETKSTSTLRLHFRILIYLHEHHFSTSCEGFRKVITLLVNFSAVYIVILYHDTHTILSFNFIENSSFLLCYLGILTYNNVLTRIKSATEGSFMAEHNLIVQYISRLNCLGLQ